jgi:hypothetical protein
MISKRHTEITIETHSLTIIRVRGDKSGLVYCRHCRENVATFRHAHAALIFRAELSEIERLSQINSIHTADDAALCGNSLAGFYSKEIHYVED